MQSTSMRKSKIHVLASEEKLKKYKDLIAINLSGEGKPWTVMPLHPTKSKQPKHLLQPKLRIVTFCCGDFPFANRPRGKTKMRISGAPTPGPEP